MDTEPKPPLPAPKSEFPPFKSYAIAALIFLTPLIVLLLAYPQGGKWNKDRNNSPIVKEKRFPKIEISAKAVYIWDMAKEETIYGKNEKEQLPLASLTKIMTALVAMDNIGESEKIKITSDAIKQEGDSGLKNQEKWRLKDLIDFSLLTSSNDGAYALASAVESRYGSSSPELQPQSQTETGPQAATENSKHKNFLDLMNKKAREISLERTFFLNETGLDVQNGSAGGYGSAEDIAKLFAYAIKKRPEIFEATAYEEIELTSLDKINHAAENTNEIVGKIPNLMASKTGYTDFSGGNLVIAFDAGFMRPIIVSVLGSTREGRFEDMEKIIEAILDYLAGEDH